MNIHIRDKHIVPHPTPGKIFPWKKIPPNIFALHPMESRIRKSLEQRGCLDRPYYKWEMGQKGLYHTSGYIDCGDILATLKHRITMADVRIAHYFYMGDSVLFPRINPTDKFLIISEHAKMFLAAMEKTQNQ